ncbi:alpha/beta fold hydrolase [Pantoea dispersa]|uniref:alpha/beta fold hydrolase n=1 Tax=Pantoea dispersa TaxID=59814 RepID=UPI0039BE4BF5
MERNAQLMFKLSPMFLQGGMLFLSDYEGEFFNFNLSSEKLSARQLDFVFCCDSFFLYQEKVSDGRICFFSNHKLSLSFAASEDIENISVFFDDENVRVILFFLDTSLCTELQWCKDSGKTVKTDNVTATLSPCMIYYRSGLQIDLVKEYACWGEGGANLMFDEILSVSEIGVILSSEAEHDNETIFISSVDQCSVRLSLPFSGVLSASFNGSKNVFYLSGIESGQQMIAEIDAITGQTLRIGDEKYGSASLLRDGNDTLVYITGSREGVLIYNPVSGSSQIIVPGILNCPRVYYENEKIKVTSLINSHNPRLNVLFFHGGPESCEWDTPRQPGMINALRKHEVNYHIINYAGSSGFGRHFRTLTDQNVLNETLPAITEWINVNLSGTELLLFGGSFGGTVLLELIARQAELQANVEGCVLINPLLDMPYHIRRVIIAEGDTEFFRKKFSQSDTEQIVIKRYADVLKTFSGKILLILGRRDEVLTIWPALELIRTLGVAENLTLLIDDGGHSSLSHFPLRSDRIVDFIYKMLSSGRALSD